MNITTIEGNLYDWVYSIVTPVKCMWLDQTAPRADASGYVGMRHASWKPLGTGTQRRVSSTTGDVTMSAHYEFVLMLIGYASGGSSIYAILDALQSQSKIRTLNGYGFSLVDIMGPNSVPQVLGNHFESRVALDLRLRTANAITYSEGYFTSVNMGLTVKDGSRVVFTSNDI
jgi:hypothetical protein